MIKGLLKGVVYTTSFVLLGTIGLTVVANLTEKDRKGSE